MKDYNDLVKLINHVNATNGIDTDMGSVCNYQDMIGHCSEEQLAELANNDKTRRAFYWIYSLCYRVDDLLTFYVKHDEKIYELRLENSELKNDNAELEAQIAEIQKARRTTDELLRSEIEDRQIAERKVEALEAEIIKLKAKLYDLTAKD